MLFSNKFMYLFGLCSKPGRRISSCALICRVLSRMPGHWRSESIIPLDPLDKCCLQIKGFAPRTRKTGLFAKGVYSYGTRPEKKGPVDADIGQKIYLEATSSVLNQKFILKIRTLAAGRISPVCHRRWWSRAKIALFALRLKP